MVRSNLQGMYIGDRWMEPLRTISRKFQEEMGFKKCFNRTGRYFETPEELSDYLKAGKCDDVMQLLEQLLSDA